MSHPNLEINGQLEVDRNRGVIYFHLTDQTQAQMMGLVTALRIEGIKRETIRIQDGDMLDLNLNSHPAEPTNRSIGQRCLERTFRADHIIHLGSMYVDETVPPSFEDLFDTEFDELMADFELEATDFDNGDGAYHFLEELIRQEKLGFLVKFSKPAPPPPGLKISPWNCTHGRWFYGETYEDVHQQALKWVDE